MSLTARFEPLQPHEERKGVAHCDLCGESLFYGDKAFQLDDDQYCEYCGSDKVKEILSLHKTSYKIGETCHECDWLFDDKGYTTYRIEGKLHCDVCAIEILHKDAEIEI